MMSEDESSDESCTIAAIRKEIRVSLPYKFRFARRCFLDKATTIFDTDTFSTTLKLAKRLTAAKFRSILGGGMALVNDYSTTHIVVEILRQHAGQWMSKKQIIDCIPKHIIFADDHWRTALKYIRSNKNVEAEGKKYRFNG